MARQRSEVLDHLAQLQAARAAVDLQMAEAIVRADEMGIARVDIARSLGITRQAVQQRLRG